MAEDKKHTIGDKSLVDNNKPSRETAAAYIETMRRTIDSPFLSKDQKSEGRLFLKNRGLLLKNIDTFVATQLTDKTNDARIQQAVNKAYEKIVSDAKAHPRDIMSDLAISTLGVEAGNSFMERTFKPKPDMSVELKGYIDILNKNIDDLSATIQDKVQNLLKSLRPHPDDPKKLQVPADFKHPDITRDMLKETVENSKVLQDPNLKHALINIAHAVSAGSINVQVIRDSNAKAAASPAAAPSGGVQGTAGSYGHMMSGEIKRSPVGKKTFVVVESEQLKNHLDFVNENIRIFEAHFVGKVKTLLNAIEADPKNPNKFKITNDDANIGNAKYISTRALTGMPEGELQESLTYIANTVASGKLPEADAQADHAPPTAPAAAPAASPAATPVPRPGGGSK
jgi:hypothetical protein